MKSIERRDIIFLFSELFSIEWNARSPMRKYKIKPIVENGMSKKLENTELSTIEQFWLEQITDCPFIFESVKNEVSSKPMSDKDKQILL